MPGPRRSLSTSQEHGKQLVTHSEADYVAIGVDWAVCVYITIQCTIAIAHLSIADTSDLI